MSIRNYCGQNIGTDGDSNFILYSMIKKEEKSTVFTFTFDLLELGVYVLHTVSTIIICDPSGWIIKVELSKLRLDETDQR